MSTSERKGVSFERIIIIVLVVLLLFALLYIAFSLGRKGAPGADEMAIDDPPTVELAGEGGADVPAGTVDEPAADQPVIADASPTSGARRLVLEPTPTPFAVSNPDDPRALLDLANPDYIDYFNNVDNWYDYDTPNIAAYRVEGGQLIGTDYDPLNKGVYWSYTSMQSGRVYAEISAINGDCAGRDAVGFVIRIDPEQTPSGYAFEVSCDGAWRLLRYRETGPTATQIDWTASDTINQGIGAVNRMGIWGYDGKFYLFINGFEVGEHWDAGMPYSFGYFAAYVRSAVTYDLTARFDDFAFWNIPFIP